MDIKILEKDENKIKFNLEDTNPAFANELRKIMVSEVPSMAVDYIEIEKNGTSLFDETLAHRLGLIPLTYDESVYNIKSECSCKGKGCNKCQVHLVLEKQGPCEVYASDLKSTDETVQPTDENILIANVKKDSELKLQAVATLGKGEDHAKFQSAVVGYKMKPKIRIDHDKVKNIKELVNICPKNILVEKDGKLGVENSAECTMCNACVDLSDGVNVSEDESSIIMTVESVSGLKPEQIIKKAFDILETKSEELMNSIKKVK